MQNIRINSLSKSFGDLQVLANFNIEFLPNKIHCLFGPSGCGKTTLLQLLSGLLTSDRGSIEGVTDLSFSYVFQEDRLLPWATVKDNITFVLRNGKSSKRAAEATAEKYLSMVGLSRFQHYYPDQLSGGMKQRVAIARAFAFQGDVLLLDEPFKGLDYELKKCLMDYILAYWYPYKPFCLFVTHNVEEALYLADQIHVLSGPPLKVTQQLTINIPHEDRHNQSGQINIYKDFLIGVNRGL